MTAVINNFKNSFDNVLFEMNKLKELVDKQNNRGKVGRPKIIRTEDEIIEVKKTYKQKYNDNNKGRFNLLQKKAYYKKRISTLQEGPELEKAKAAYNSVIRDLEK